MVTLRDSYDAIRKQDLQRFESELEGTLPTPYREFLLQQNGGFIKNGAVQIKPQGNVPFKLDSMDYFFGIGTGEPFSELKPYLHVIDVELVVDLLPIAKCLGGDLVCIGVSTNTFGHIYYVHIDGKQCALADNFAYFFSNLYLDKDFIHKEQLPIFRSVEKGDTVAVRSYLQDDGEIDVRSERGANLAMVAAWNCQPEILEILLNAGTDVSAFDSNRTTTVMYAAHASSVDCTKMMLKTSIDLNTTDAAGRTALMIAIAAPSNRIPKLLLDAGASPAGKTTNSETALGSCRMHRSTDLYLALLSAGADPIGEIPELIEELEDDDQEFVLGALRMLQHIGTRAISTKSALEYLESSHADARVRQAASATLQSIAGMTK